MSTEASPSPAARAPRSDHPLTPAESMAELKAELGVEHSYFDGWLYAFLENKKFDIEETLAKLERRATMEREELAGITVDTPDGHLRQSLSKGIIQIIGTDRMGRSVLYVTTRRDTPEKKYRAENKDSFDVMVTYATRLRRKEESSKGENAQQGNSSALGTGEVVSETCGGFDIQGPSSGLVNTSCKAIMLINQEGASMLKNIDFAFQATIALRISKFYPGLIDTLYICKMSRMLQRMAKPVFGSLPAVVSERIKIVTDEDTQIRPVRRQVLDAETGEHKEVVEEGSFLTSFIDRDVLPTALGGFNDCDKEEKWKQFADDVTEYFLRLQKAVREEKRSVKEWELKCVLEELEADQKRKEEEDSVKENTTDSNATPLQSTEAQEEGKASPAQDGEGGAGASPAANGGIEADAQTGEGVGDLASAEELENLRVAYDSERHLKTLSMRIPPEELETVKKKKHLWRGFRARIKGTLFSSPNSKESQNGNHSSQPKSDGTPPSAVDLTTTSSSTGATLDTPSSPPRDATAAEQHASQPVAAESSASVYDGNGSDPDAEDLEDERRVAELEDFVDLLEEYLVGREAIIHEEQQTKEYFLDPINDYIVSLRAPPSKKKTYLSKKYTDAKARLSAFRGRPTTTTSTQAIAKPTASEVVVVQRKSVVNPSTIGTDNSPVLKERSHTNGSEVGGSSAQDDASAQSSETKRSGRERKSTAETPATSMFASVLKAAGSELKVAKDHAMEVERKSMTIKMQETRLSYHSEDFWKEGDGEDVATYKFFGSISTNMLKAIVAACISLFILALVALGRVEVDGVLRIAQICFIMFVMIFGAFFSIESVARAQTVAIREKQLRRNIAREVRETLDFASKAK